MSGLETFFATIEASKLKAEAWVDGSFLTEKPDPKDVDVVVRITDRELDAATPDQEAVLDWINGDDPKASCHCDCYCFVEYGNSHYLANRTIWMRAYWIKQFGFDRNEEMKGMALINLPAAP